MINNPFILFKELFSKITNLNLKEPAAVFLATCDKLNPSVRTVLLRQYDERGFCFFTNLKSHKASQIYDNPKAAILVYSDELQIQIRIEGDLEELSSEESDKYFAGRARKSRIGAWASIQSQIMQHPDDLKNRVEYYSDKFKNIENIPRPEFWGGFRLIPSSFEFWEGKEFRLHDRTKFIKNNDKWDIVKLYP